MTEQITLRPDTPETLKRILEAALLSAVQPMAMADFQLMFDEDVPVDTLRILLDELRADWNDRPAELVQLASGWRFRTRPEFMPFIERLNPERPPRYSRAVLETLAIIVYRQPVTRGDIEDIRGVTVSTGVIKALEERGWIDVVGHRETPGRPGLYATTRKFLDDLGLRSLNELPPLEHVDTRMLDLPMPEVMPVRAVESMDAAPALALDEASVALAHALEGVPAIAEATSEVSQVPAPLPDSASVDASPKADRAAFAVDADAWPFDDGVTTASDDQKTAEEKTPPASME